jgi:hypothetical protein
MAQLSKKVELYAAANGVSSVDFRKDVFLADDGDGVVYIKEWNISGLAQPTNDQIASYETAGNTAETLSGVLNKRKKEYPSIADQLDKIYHDGIDEWKKVIKAVKDANPKG